MKHRVLASNRSATKAAGKPRQCFGAEAGPRRRLAEDSSTPPDVLPLAASRGLNRKPLVLLVEDDLPISEMALLLIRRLGVEAAPAGNGREGFRLAQQLVPDAIVTDVDIPGMSGLELCEQLKAEPATAGIPILVWSGNSNHRALALAAGAVEFLAKPGGVPRLTECLRRILGL